MSEADNEKLQDQDVPEQEEAAEEPETELTVQEEAKETEIENTEETEEDEEDTLPVITHVSKFSQKTINIIQAILGILAGGAIWLCITFGSGSDNVLLQYMFVIVFAVVMLTQRAVERKLGLSTRVFVKFWLIGLVVFLAVFVIYGIATGQFTSGS
ncbi:MAG: hypothetical protein VB081_07780 [Christensenella sp.]|uniref:hypothetical protein n=1 Tax=Christensenella sp. TaxID=1935934 RepID=UPI002B213B42|nr:hypothetical protein [Christensenella sp.]MEA5003383.1 hypothetical protein [Christensenella sp.]